jgi:hypothetical protein
MNQLSSSFSNAQLPRNAGKLCSCIFPRFCVSLVLPKYGPFYRFCFMFYVCTDMLPFACVQQPKLQRISRIKQKFKGMWPDWTLCSMKQSFHRKEVHSYSFTSVVQSHDLAHLNLLASDTIYKHLQPHLFIRLAYASTLHTFWITKVWLEIGSQF